MSTQLWKHCLQTAPSLGSMRVTMSNCSRRNDSDREGKYWSYQPTHLESAFVLRQTRWRAAPRFEARVRSGSILLKKSKIERLRKSREGRFLIASAAANLCRTRTKVCHRLCANRCGPSRCRAWDAPAGLRNFVRLPEMTFSTVSVISGPGREHPQCPLLHIESGLVSMIGMAHFPTVG